MHVLALLDVPVEGGALRRVGEIGLGEHQPVSDSHLLGAFGLTGELGRAVHRIDRRDDVAQAEMMF